MPTANSQQQGDALVFFVNGRKVVEDKPDPEWTLLFYLREKLGLRGSKLGCGEGGCGACTVMLSRMDHTGELRHVAVNACLAPVCSLHGQAVTTVEGIGSTRTKLHAVQERISRSHGSQCGYCTPGIVMSMYALLRSAPGGKPNEEGLEEALQGNLCRCTGYRPIIEGFRTLLEEWETPRGSANNGQEAAQGCCQKGEGCCQKKSGGCGYASNGSVKEEEEASCRQITDRLVPKNTFAPYDPSQEPIFPPELKLDKEDVRGRGVEFRGPRVTWYRPRDLAALLELKKKHPEARLVVGNTEVGLETKYKGFVYPVLVQPSLVEELHAIVTSEEGIAIGAALPLSDVQAHLERVVSEMPAPRTRVFRAVLEMLHWFAGRQIRNVGCIGGNLATASPISDLSPTFLAANCRVELRSADRGTRFVEMDANFFPAYRKTIMAPDEVLVSVRLPFTSENHHFLALKQAKRREDDIAIVNAAFSVQLRGKEVVGARLAYGGMAATPVMAPRTAEALRGRLWDKDTLQVALDSLVEELPVDPGAPGGEARYRRCLALGLFLKFFLSVQQERGEVLEPSEASATLHLPPGRLAEGSQYFELVSDSQPRHDLVGRPEPHLAAARHATGEAVYCDDMVPEEGELHLALVLSSRAHARLLGVDGSAALALPGVVTLLSAADLDPELNTYGMLAQDETVFARGTVRCQGQVIAAVVAETREIAQRAARLVVVKYEDLPPIVTIEEAIAANSLYEPMQGQKFSRGDVEAGLTASEVTLEGEMRVGGQEHFYLETHAARAAPGEDGEMHVAMATQSPAAMQGLIAGLLRVPLNRVTVTVRRIGGGFGGKETRSAILVLPVVLAAHRLGRPVRGSLERDEDMLVTGGRHPFLGRYRLGASTSGKLSTFQLDMFSNGGYTLDYSNLVMTRAAMQFPGSYRLDHAAVNGVVCKTNLPSNTAFRGFGSPQCCLIIEAALEDLAHHMGVDPVEIRRQSLVDEGDKTPYNEVLERCTLRRCWQQCEQLSSFQKRREEVLQFNKNNRWRKRGISLIPLTYPVCFHVPFLNQGAALVHVYTDGSVLVAHGGVEMGQGLHTKMKQVASRALGVPECDIHMTDTCTASVPNTISTAASFSSDLNGMAILAACSELTARLAPYREALGPKVGWVDWVKAAYFDRVSLSATGFHKVPGLDYDWEKMEGRIYSYYSYGAACSEVEVDCLTGDHKLLRTDIVMDVGESINPAIDVGQIEGGFLQGVGLFTTEQVLFSPRGELLTRGPSTYKIPGFADAPAQFNVTLLRGSGNPRAVYSSKAVGEPPLLLANSVWCAIYGAVAAARRDAGNSGRFRFDSPATPARIRMACSDLITDKIPEAAPGSFKPWNVDV